MAAVDDWSSAAGALEQWWDMGRATNLAEFEAALRRLQVPIFTVIYADRDGHVLSLFNGQVPVRPAGDGRLVRARPRRHLGHALDRDPPLRRPAARWSIRPAAGSRTPTARPGTPPTRSRSTRTTTRPYMAPQYLSWRERRGIRMLEENPRDLAGADGRAEVLDADGAGRPRPRRPDRRRPASGDATASEAADVLAAWDRRGRPASTGALLFAFWRPGPAASRRDLPALFARRWDPAEPLTTPRGLADPEEAVQALIDGGRTDAGTVRPARRALGRGGPDASVGSVDVPANGFQGDPFGVFRVL